MKEKKDKGLTLPIEKWEQIITLLPNMSWDSRWNIIIDLLEEKEMNKDIVTQKDIKALKDKFSSVLEDLITKNNLKR